MTTGTKELYEIGEIPPIGEVPASMYAQVIRRERFGEPSKAFAREKVRVPDIEPNEVLVFVMAAGINYNNVWAALGSPVDVINVHEQLGDAVDLVVDAGESPIGEGSTVLDATGPTLVVLRTGAVPIADIAKATGMTVQPPL